MLHLRHMQPQMISSSPEFWSPQAEGVYIYDIYLKCNKTLTLSLTVSITETPTFSVNLIKWNIEILHKSSYAAVSWKFSECVILRKWLSNGLRNKKPAHREYDLNKGCISLVHMCVCVCVCALVGKYVKNVIELHMFSLHDEYNETVDASTNIAEQ